MTEDREPLLSTTIDVPSDSPRVSHHQQNNVPNNLNHKLPDTPAILTGITTSSSSGRFAPSQLSSSSYTTAHSRTPPSSSESNFVRVIERNVEYIRGHFDEFFSSRTGPGTSLFVPVICCTILILYIINTIAWHRSESRSDPSVDDGDPAFDKHLPALVKLLTISPGSLLIPYNWLWTGLSILTYPVVELYFYQVLMDIVVVTLSTTLIDPLWGRKELYRFFLFVNIVVAVLTTSHYIVIYAWKGDAVYLYGVTIYGLTGYIAAVCVTVKQLLPESVVFATSIGKFKNNHIPISSLLFSWILYLLNLTSGVSVITFFYGTITSWIYLRFLQFHPTNGTRGDLSDGFAFATFFPNVLQPLASLLANALYSFFVRIKVCPDYAGSPAYQSVRVLSERLTDNFRVPRRNQHKYHPSGDYEHLHQPTPPVPTSNRNLSNVGGASTSSTSRIDL